MRMEQYLTFNDHALWEVIVNGDSVSPYLSASAGAEAIPDEHLLNSCPEDANLKLLRSLPSAWNNIALIMRNKSDLDTLSMDDLYNNLKVYESEIKGQTKVSDASYKDLNVLTASYADVVMFTFLDNQSNAHSWTMEDSEQIGSPEVIEDKISNGMTKVECYNCHRRGHFYQRCRAPKEIRGIEIKMIQEGLLQLKQAIQIAIALFIKGSSGGETLPWGGENHLEARIVVHEKNEAVYEENIEFLKYDDPQVKKIFSINELMNHFNISAKDKTGLGYDGQMNESELNNIHMNESEVVHSVFNSRESDVDDSLVNDRFKTGRVTSQREVRPVWNNAQSVNHQNKLTHPHLKRNFVPTAVATKSKLVPVNAAKQRSPRSATSISTARPVNTIAPKSKVNDALPKIYSYFKAHSPVRRTFNQKSATKTNNLNEKVKTARVKNVTTAGPKAVVSDAEGKRENVVKSLACWIWRPTGKVIDHISKDSGSYMPKRFDYGNPQYALQDQGIFDSGCSRHMTGNKSYLTDYQDIDGGFVAFAGSPKGGKITGKGKIRTGKLDFEDVYFVKELKFNLFSVSQMCDKKNSVLFTETECLVLSPDFKLLDESQVLLKVPRQNNMYNFDLKNVVPSGGLTCLFAKATIDDSNLWYRRLGHINFKTINKLVRGNLVRGEPGSRFASLALSKLDHTCVASSEDAVADDAGKKITEEQHIEE
ncbi:ribonuclease H-like domain-containing protein [Tanacetum coccineum]